MIDYAISTSNIASAIASVLSTINSQKDENSSNSNGSSNRDEIDSGSGSNLSSLSTALGTTPNWTSKWHKQEIDMDSMGNMSMNMDGNNASSVPVEIMQGIWIYLHLHLLIQMKDI